MSDRVRRLFCKFWILEFGFWNGGIASGLPIYTKLKLLATAGFSYSIQKKYMDEIIIKTFDPRNRIMLELMARSAMRIGEVLKIRPIDVQDHKITLPEPKSG